jgi:hypothetical protein
MHDAMTIPVLPCVSMDDTLGFYQALGFEVTHRQTRPNVYAATRCGDVHIHFMGLPGLDPARSYSTCLVIVPEVEPLHERFAAALRRRCGRVPLTGLPRITRMRPGQSRFTITDVAGNSVIFIRRDARAEREDPAPPATGGRLARALRTAARLRDFRTDDEAAARVLDAALAHGDADPALRGRALAARAELAVVLGDDERARGVRAELEVLLPALPDDVRVELVAQLEAIDALQR